MFVVCRLEEFGIDQVGGPKVAFKVLPDKMVGYLPVYHTREEALADYPDSELMEIQQVEVVE